MARFGVVALFSYLLFIFYIFADNIYTGKAKLSEINMFTSDIADICGNFALAFMVHNAIT
jgi:hypothetical protein